MVYAPISLSVLALLATGAVAAPAKRDTTSTAASSTLSASPSNTIGVSVSDVYPPLNTAPNSALFPGEEQVGYQQPTPTGVEPFAIATGIAYPTRADIYPLVVPQPSSTGTQSSKKESFDISQNWGNLSPQYSVDSSVYGLENATPALPEQCDIVQFHTYFRHGARYPTTGEAPSSFAEKLHNASLAGFEATGPLAFLNNWTYKLGAELLTPYGRLQDFKWGIAARQLYGHLLNNFTESGNLPVFRTQSQDRMIKTMDNFAAGFFGVPEFLTSFNKEIQIEAPGFNATGAPYEVCPNSDNERGSVGSTEATRFSAPYYAKAADRLNQYLSGNLTFDTTDVNAALQLCAYETVSLGSSEFCKLFTQEEYEVFEQAFDIQFSGNVGAQSPVSAAQGLGYLEELVSRLEKKLITNWDSNTNSTLDGNNVTFPLDQSVYADAAHEVAIADALTALNLTALQEIVPTDRLSTTHSYRASRIVPFATVLQIQVLECEPSVPTKQIRFIVNDAVIPIHDSYEGCSEDPNGLCALDTVVAALKKRIAEIDFDYDCNGNYTVPTYGAVTNGRAPRE
ncbi:hypothetical protein JCM10213_006581 [Rhodosporidiobolus nylandii]